MAMSREQVATIASERLDEVRRRLVARVNPLAEQFRAWYQKREPREKRLIQIGAAISAVFLAYNLIYRPALALRDDLNSRVDARQREVIEVQRLAQTCMRLKAELSSVEKKTVPPGRDFSLFSILEGTLSKSVGRDKIGSITPSDRKISNELVEYTVDLKLSGVSLAQLVDALYGVQTLSVPVMVSNLSIKKRFQDSHSYDVELTCFALGKNA